MTDSEPMDIDLEGTTPKTDKEKPKPDTQPKNELVINFRGKCISNYL